MEAKGSNFDEEGGEGQGMRKGKRYREFKGRWRWYRSGISRSLSFTFTPFPFITLGLTFSPRKEESDEREECKRNYPLNPP